METMCRIADNMKNYSYKKNSFWKFKNCFVTDSFKLFQSAADFLKLKEKKILLVAEMSYASHFTDEITKVLMEACAGFSVCEIESEKENPEGSLMKIRDEAESLDLGPKDAIVSFGGSYADLISAAYISTLDFDVSYIRIPLTFTTQLIASGDVSDVVEVDAERIAFAAEVLKGSRIEFKRPDLVYINLLTYRFLSDDERLSGMGEAIRCAVASDKNLFSYIENNTGKKTDNFTEFLLNLVMNCLEINKSDAEGSAAGYKAKFGYTVARGLERCTNYIIPHGSAVGIGMVVAGGVSGNRNLFKTEDSFRMAKLMVTYGLSVSMNFTDELIEAITDSIRKEEGLVSEDGVFRSFVLLDSFGKVRTADDVRMDEILKVMNYRRF